MSYTGGNPQQDLADNEEAFAVGVEASSTVMHRRVEVPPRISQGVWQACYRYMASQAISVGV